MSAHTAYNKHGNPRPSAGQRGRAGSPQRHSLESLIGDIDSYIAEQEAYSRDGGSEELGRARSDSRGTMFVDMDDEGEMVVSYRHQPREPISVPSREEDGGEGDFPQGDLYVVGGHDGGGGQETSTDAPRYMTSHDGVQYVRVGVNALGKGIYVQKKEGQRYEVEAHIRPARRSSHPSTPAQHHHHQHYRRTPYPPSNRPEDPRRSQPTHPSNGFYAGGREDEYPRPMHRVENKPLPPVPREACVGAHDCRLKRELLWSRALDVECRAPGLRPMD